MKKVPTLRFKEFSGEWESKRLGKITKLTDGVHFTPIYVNSGVPFWSVETVVSNAPPKYITQEAHNDAIKRCHPEVNDILLTRIGTLAKPKLIDWNQEFSIYVSLALIKSSDNYNSKFARYYFETEYYQKDFLSKSLLTATPKKINMEDLKQTNINLPSKEEQQKIASFFCLIDNKISLQDEKVERLKDYKKGMMQKIFSRELRFKDDEGREYPEWEKMKLGDVTVKVGPKNKENKNYEVYSINNRVGFIPQNEQFEDSRLDGLDKSLYKIINKGEFAYNPARINVGSIGVLEEDKIVIVSSLYVCFKFINNLNYRFFMQYFLYGQFNKDVIRNTEGTVREYLFYENFSNIKVNIPCLEEQNKIAKLLDSLDKKIKIEQEKLYSLNEYKKGLLQQMFV